MLLLARLAADTGARRAELAALQPNDLDGDVLTISRATSGEVVGPTKIGRIRRITLGATTADLWHETVATWQTRLAAEAPTAAVRRWDRGCSSRRKNHLGLLQGLPLPLWDEVLQGGCQRARGSSREFQGWRRPGRPSR